MFNQIDSMILGMIFGFIFIVSFFFISSYLHKKRGVRATDKFILYVSVAVILLLLGSLAIAHMLG